VANRTLTARLQLLRGDAAGAAATLAEAAAEQDSWYYDEPPDWYYPTRQVRIGMARRSRSGSCYSAVGRSAARCGARAADAIVL
jgi:hypothetical protein